MTKPANTITKQTPYAIDENTVVPFDNAEEAWFWFIAAQQAKNEGARFVAGCAMVQRPCEPLDILKILDRLHRNRRLQRDHLLVLRHYGRRHMAPDPYRVREARAAMLWAQAMERMSESMMRKKIIRPQGTHENWARSIAAQSNDTSFTHAQGTLNL